MGIKRDISKIGRDFTKGLRKGGAYMGPSASIKRRITRNKGKDFLPKPKFGNFENLF